MEAVAINRDATGAGVRILGILVPWNIITLSRTMLMLEAFVLYLQWRQSNLNFILPIRAL